MTALALAGVLAAGACGSNDNKADAQPKAKAAHESKAATTAAEFCASAKTLYDQLTAAGPNGPTSPEVKAVFAEAKALEAPATIAADWTAILDQLVAPVVSGEIDVNNPQSASQLAARASQLGGALQRTGKYFDTQCHFG